MGNHRWLVAALITLAAASWPLLAASPPAGMALGWGPSVMLPGILFTNIAAGGDQSLAIRSDGTVYAWGALAGAPASASNVIAVAGGGSTYGMYGSDDQCLALKADGTIVAWGYYDYHNQTKVPPSATSVVAVALGATHSVALRSDGRIVVWGDNSFAQTNLPANLTNFTAIAAGYYHSLARRQDGTVNAWGSTTYVPAAATNVAALAAGYNYSVALRSNGTVIAWTPTSTYSNFPTNCVAIAAGGDNFRNHALALRDDGTVYAWGDNYYGQSTVPAGLSNVVAIAAGRYHSLALRSDHTIVTWGAPGTNQFDCLPLNGMKAVAAGGGGYSLALRSDGAVTDWSGGSSLPRGLTNLTAIAVGGGHRLALRKDGKVLAWGSNTYGQTNGIGTWSNIIAIAAGAYHSLALRSNGTVLAVGSSDRVGGGGESSVPFGLTNVVAISTLGWYPSPAPGGIPDLGFSLALKSDGTVVGWGQGSGYGEVTPPAGLAGVVAVAAGAVHSLALQSDGTVLGWGYNRHGEATGVPTTASPYRATNQVMVAGQVLSNVVAIAAGTGHSLALRNDGTVVGWGWNYYGQTNVPATISNVVAIAAGESQSLAIQIELQIGSIALGDLGPVIGLRTFAGQNYAVEYSPDLSPDSWSPLPNGTVPGDGQDATVTDTEIPPPNGRFYRVRLLP